MYYLAVLTIVDAARNQQERPAHLRYISDLYEQGYVQEAGPFADGSGGLVIYQNVDENTARRLAEADPAVTSGARTLRLIPWKVLDLPLSGS